jgi:uncharacterized membrane protein
MSSVTVDMEVRTYFAALEKLLDDLPEDDQSELLEDLEQHLSEVAAEADGSLEERLGPPEAYAAELRASAGLPARDMRARRRLAERIRHSSIGKAWELPVVQSVRRFLPELRPGWWVLRGYLGVLALDFVLYHHGYSSVFPIPYFGGSQVIGLLAIIAAVFASIQLGRRSREPRLRIVSIAANIAGAITFLAVMTAYIGPSYGEDPAAFEIGFSGFLQHSDGTPISNICAYDSKLRPLDRVLLFDQHGRPIDNVAEPEVWAEYGNPLAKKLDRMAFPNTYPREQIVQNPQTGETRVFECPSLRRSDDPGAEKKASDGAEKKASKEDKGD